MHFERLVLPPEGPRPVWLVDRPPAAIGACTLEVMPSGRVIMWTPHMCRARRHPSAPRGWPSRAKGDVPTPKPIGGSRLSDRVTYRAWRAVELRFCGWIAAQSCVADTLAEVGPANGPERVGRRVYDAL